MLSGGAAPVAGRIVQLRAVAGGGAAVAVQRADAAALSLGSKVGAGGLMLACVLAIVAGASSMLASLKSMERKVQVMNEQVAVVNASNDVLNETLDSLPPTARDLNAIVGTVRRTSVQVKKSGRSVEALAADTARLNGQLGAIASGTADMRRSLQSLDSSAVQLDGTLGDINGRLDPLVKAQRATRGEVGRMGTGIGGMNGSLAYVIRTLNYLAAPPGGGGFMVRVEVPKETLPPVPGLKAEADAAQVFPPGAWPQYTGP